MYLQEEQAIWFQHVKEQLLFVITRLFLDPHGHVFPNNQNEEIIWGWLVGAQQASPIPEWMCLCPLVDGMKITYLSPWYSTYEALGLQRSDRNRNDISGNRRLSKSSTETKLDGLKTQSPMYCVDYIFCRSRDVAQHMPECTKPSNRTTCNSNHKLQVEILLHHLQSRRWLSKNVMSMY